MEPLPATPQPFLRRLARGLYWRLLALSFRLLKPMLSALRNRLQPRATWPGHDATWPDLEAYAEWLPRHVRWHSDPLNGLVDTFPDRETIAAQFRAQGYFADDCDGLAFFSAQNVRNFADDPERVYIVTVVLDPYTFPQNPLLYAAHVICVFLHKGVWRVISNDTLYRQYFSSFAEAVQNNPYCAGHPVLWAEVRNAELKPIVSGQHLAAFAV
jgi:hypothetical protein